MAYSIRQLIRTDIAAYLPSLIATYENLSAIGDVSVSAMEAVFDRMAHQGSIIYIALTPVDGIVGCATLLVEQKMQKQGACAGHIEDVVVRKGFEGQGIAKALLEKLMEESMKYNCYKVILDCEASLVPLYEKFGFCADGIFMRKYVK